MATKPSNLPKPQKSNSTVVPYPSPPNSPRQTKSPVPEVPKVSEDEARPAGTVSLAPLRPPSASPQNSFASTASLKPEENKDDVSELRTAPELKTRLGLDSGRCGGLSKSGRPCKNCSPAANKAHIVSQFELMTDLTQTSPELDSALDTLATLVHCRHHDSGPPKKSRIDAWMTEFPVGEAGADPTASVEKQIRKILDLVSAQCIGVVSSKQSRCKGTIGGQRVQNCAATIAEIVRPEVYLNDAYLDSLLKVLETNMLCPEHINRQPLEKVERWKSAVGEIREKQLAKPVGGDAPEGMINSSRPSNIQSSERSPTKTGAGSAPSGGLSIPNFGDLSTYWPTTYDASPFDIAKSNGPDPNSSYARVKSEMTKVLGPADLSSGYVYAYEVQGNSGYVKIGYTTRSVEERHEEWKFDCNRVPKVLYPMPSGTIAVVSNARRVEAICHAELGHRRITIDCRGCLKRHLEWFEVSAAEAIAVIQKWSKWMATDPYQSESRSVVK